MRKFIAPVFEERNLANNYPVTDVIISPDDRWVVAAVSATKESPGKIVFYSRRTMMRAYEIRTTCGV